MNLGYQKLGSVEGGIRFCLNANSYVVWLRPAGGNYGELTPAYGNGVDAESRLEDELLTAEISNGS